ncbi:MAG: T9SS type A sorting domain-containing protein [Bacteroidetes bacterium]|jgi:hypothetical protein|nr:T9SS type A sorting domain-containing protein [Bacteroidota bacterium]
MTTKKLILFLICFQSAFTALAQQCLPEGIVFTNQSQINNFQFDFPGCTKITGSVFIYGNDIQDLTGLSVINSIGEHLSFGYQTEGNPQLLTLSGLENLDSIGGYLTITNNHNLSSLSGLDSLKSIGGGLTFWSNHGLQNMDQLINISNLGGPLMLFANKKLNNIEGLSNIEGIDGEVFIQVHDSLMDLNGLSGLVTVNGNVNISYNQFLESMEGLSKLENINGHLIIEDNPNLKSLQGLENLHAMGGSLTINSNPQLESILSLSNLSSIEGRIRLTNNDLLESLEGLDNIDPTTITKVVLRFNNKLSNCAAPSVCSYLNTDDPDFDVVNNEDGCDNLVQIEEACQIIGVYEINQPNKIRIYPNPARSTLRFQASDDILVLEIAIYDKTEKKILKGYPDDSHELNVSFIPQGLYIVEFIHTKGVIRKKLITFR